MKYLKFLAVTLALVAAWVYRDAGGAYVRMALGSETSTPKSAAKPAAPAVPVVVATVEQKTMPVEFRSIGSVQTESSVVVKVRVESVVESVLVADGSMVKSGDILVELDKRQISAQIEQAKAAILRDEAQIEQAMRNDTRTTDLATRGFGARVTADDAKTAASVAAANKAADMANLKALELQRSFHTITAPIDGRVGVVNVRPGAFVRNADANSIIATINQIDPIYVALAVPQNLLPQILTAMKAGTASIELKVPGAKETVAGAISMIDNTVDTTTGLLTIRARVPNASAVIWPGQVADTRVIIRREPDAIVIPNEAIQTSQAGNFVFVIDAQNFAHVRPITVARTVENETVVEAGLKVGERVVTDGQLRVVEGAKTVVQPAAKSEVRASAEGAE